MKVAVILNFDVETPEYIADILSLINPPSIMGFTGEAHVVPEPSFSELQRWLNSDEAPEISETTEEEEEGE